MENEEVKELALELDDAETSLQLATAQASPACPESLERLVAARSRLQHAQAALQAHLRGGLSFPP